MSMGKPSNGPLGGMPQQGKPEKPAEEVLGAGEDILEVETISVKSERFTRKEVVPFKLDQDEKLEEFARKIKSELESLESFGVKNSGFEVLSIDEESNSIEIETAKVEETVKLEDFNGKLNLIKSIIDYYIDRFTNDENFLADLSHESQYVVGFKDGIEDVYLVDVEPVMYDKKELTYQSLMIDEFDRLVDFLSRIKTDEDDLSLVLDAASDLAGLINDGLREDRLVGANKHRLGEINEKLNNLRKN